MKYYGGLFMDTVYSIYHHFKSTYFHGNRMYRITVVCDISISFVSYQINVHFLFIKRC